jgi:hypothetical protein
MPPIWLTVSAATGAATTEEVARPEPRSRGSSRIIKQRSDERDDTDQRTGTGP